MTPHLHLPESGTDIVSRLAEGLAALRARRRAEKRRRRAQKHLDMQPDWLLDDIGARRTAVRTRERARRGFW